MKTIKKTVGFLALLLALTISFSCRENDPGSPEPGSNESINNWIQEWMEYCYLWNDKIPAKTDKSLRPDEYFESLLYKQEDRFSRIMENFTDLLNLLSGVQWEAGYDYRLFWADQEEHNIIGIINYIKPNSPASETDLKRGDIFSAINGTRLTENNYNALTDSLSEPHTLGIISRSNELDSVTTISLPSVVKYEENPVFLDTVYNIAGKRIGYLVYNFFANDKGDNSIAYAKELNSIFGQFKTTGINELILDLRYNGGGDVTACIALSSMISNRNSNDLFSLSQYNSNVDQEGKTEIGEDYDKSYFVNNLLRYDDKGEEVERTSINKLTGLDRLFVITSDRTASASELVINCLNPYMEVILIGETTYGKNVGSFTIYEEDAEKQKTNKWGMLPIIVKFANSQRESDYGNGFTPDEEISEYSKPLVPFGNTDETMLQAALVRMGVIQTPTNLRADKRNTLIPLFSSIDKTPVRRNMYVKPEKLRLKQFGRHKRYGTE
jgi:C-terminal processing protease CtpA/Prc